MGSIDTTDKKAQLSGLNLDNVMQENPDWTIAELSPGNYIGREAYDDVVEQMRLEMGSISTWGVNAWIDYYRVLWKLRIRNFKTYSAHRLLHRKKGWVKVPGYVRGAYYSSPDYYRDCRVKTCHIVDYKGGKFSL